MPWVYSVWGSLGFLELGGYFLPYFREVFDYYLLKYFLMPFLFVFFFWDTYDSNIGAFNFVPEEDKKKGHEKILEEIILEKFPKMGKEIATQVQEIRVPNRINPR